MTKTMRRGVGVAAISLLALLGSTAPAAAITGGRPDGNGHPNVGLIVFYDQEGRFRCSATLVTPAVLITAAPSGFPVAANPAAGYTSAEIEASGNLAGSAMAHPNYSNFTDLGNWNDVGVIVLDKPVVGITPATPATGRYLDAFEEPVLKCTIFELVGYGH